MTMEDLHDLADVFYDGKGDLRVKWVLLLAAVCVIVCVSLVIWLGVLLVTNPWKFLKTLLFLVLIAAGIFVGLLITAGLLDVFGRRP